MKRYVTAAPNGEPPVSPAATPTPLPTETPRCNGRPDLRSGRRLPHRTPTPRHHAAASHPDREALPTHATVDPDCRRFTEFVLRSILEVLDRRRHPSGLTGLLAPTPLNLVSALTRAGMPGRSLGAAGLRGVHIRHTTPDSAEVFGTYVRGPRTFAIAGRVERAKPGPRSNADTTKTTTTHRRNTGTPVAGWVVTSLQVG